MMIRVNLFGASSWTSRLATLNEGMHLRIRRALLLSALIVKRQIQQNLSGPAHLRYSYYDRGSGSNRMAALMGGDGDFGKLVQSTRRRYGARYEETTNTNPYPGVRTGAYRASIRTMLNPSGFSARIYTNLVYPFFLEYGTRKMRPYPVFGPSLEQVEDEVTSTLQNTVWGAMTA